jgi:predicted nuclease of predicted toxin-antitoxin system
MDERLRYYLDEHMRPAIAEGLRARGIDAITTGEADRAHRGLSDEDQLRFAASGNRVLVTEDRDFARAAIGRLPHAGIVYFPVQLGRGRGQHHSTD